MVATVSLLDPRTDTGHLRARCAEPQFLSPWIAGIPGTRGCTRHRFSRVPGKAVRLSAVAGGVPYEQRRCKTDRAAKDKASPASKNNE